MTFFVGLCALLPAQVPEPGATTFGAVDLRCGGYCVYVALKGQNISVPSYQEFEKRLGQPDWAGYSMQQLCEVAKSYGGAGEKPVVEGDLKLVQVLLDAQAANLVHFGSGELRAVHRTSGSKRPTSTLHVHQIWSGEKSYWDFDYDVRHLDQPREKNLVPIHGRMIFDGKEYTKHITGEVQILPEAEFHNFVPDYWHMDQRPKERWTRSSGRGRPWAELLGPHPNFPSEEIEKWRIEQKGDNVIIERHDRYEDGTTGLVRTVASMALAGNVLESTYRGPTQTKDVRFTWRSEAGGRIALEKAWSRWKHAGGTVEEELVVTSLVVRDVPASQFDIKSLQIPRGAVVEDLIRNRRYTFDGRKVDQESLDKLSKEVGSKKQATPSKKGEKP